ncbi:PLANT CADMIUM RESISTANCE 2 Q9LQU4 [Pyrrhoderma noxium]|uniref:PLANT CADMIUM RESISTANCE 2 Q9LQU4 n=1 Tax=Pyrrhoderma noxium TaxID=2282107 RepID=A0A286UHI8_9AGAM|nr:PLANT CADMIUM RESISTANCE 2 Q9LQU4 [Pyrrhoderma noxium]
MSTSGEERPWKQENLVFSSNNCDCSGLCWFSWCCSCCLVQRNYNRYKYIRDHDKGKNTDEGDLNSKCGLMCCVQTFTTGWAHMILPCYVRGKIRDQLDIEGGWCGDFLATACCLPCSLIQEGHETREELIRRGVDSRKL